jgi:hypothetical protein
MFSRKDRPDWKELIREVVAEGRTLISQEIALAKKEISATMALAGKGAGMLAAAALLAIIGLIPLVMFLGLGTAALLRLLGLGLLTASWLGFAVVAVLLFLVAGILVMAGVKRLKGFSPKPSRAIGALREPLEYPSAAPDERSGV